MKVGLIPQVWVNAQHPRESVPYVPLGLLCLAGALDRDRHPVEIVDLTDLVREGAIAYDERFNEEAARLIISKGFDVVGFSSFSASYHHTLMIAAHIKKFSPKTVVTFGGPQASFCDIETMKYFPVDYVVRGEGEIAFANLLDGLDEDRAMDGVGSLTYRVGDHIRRSENLAFIPDLDRLPYPAYELYPIKNHPKVPIEGTRGCPFKCVYCATSIYWGRQVRHKTPQRIFEEMNFLNDRYAVQQVSFTDDTFTINRDKASELCEHLIEKSAPVRWLCSTRIDAVDDVMLELMSKAGCINIFYGIETGSPKIQKSIRKNIKLESVIENVKLTAKHGIGVTPSLMMGFPDETEDDLVMTLNLRNEIKRIFPSEQVVQLHVLAPDVHTEITQNYSDQIEYDGFHSDHAGAGFTGYDKDLILNHKNLFLSYYYIKMRHLDRKFIRRLSTFMFTTQLFAYWSSLYVMLKDRNPLALFKKWLEFHKSFELPPGISPDAPEQTVGAVSVTAFLEQYFKGPHDIPDCIRELALHEAEKGQCKGLVITVPDIRKLASRGEAISTKDYSYDPDMTIMAIRKSIEAVDKVERSPVRVEYFQKGSDQAGPTIAYRKI